MRAIMAMTIEMTPIYVSDNQTENSRGILLNVQHML